jgi:hypothetical protein
MPHPPQRGVTICDFKRVNSEALSSDMKSFGKRSLLCFTTCTRRPGNDWAKGFLRGVGMIRESWNDG